MEHFEYLKSISGVCHTPCPYHDGVMIGSAKCESCIYCEYLMPNGETPYVECRFKEFADEEKSTKPNSLGNRLKAKIRGDKELGYVDGYIGDGGIAYAIVYYPSENALKAIRIRDLQIIKEGE